MPLMITSDRRLSKVAQLLNAAHRSEPAKHISYSQVVAYMRAASSGATPVGLGLLEEVDNGVGTTGNRKPDGSLNKLTAKRLQVKKTEHDKPVETRLCYNSEWDGYPIIMVTPGLLQKLENHFFPKANA